MTEVTQISGVVVPAAAVPVVDQMRSVIRMVVQAWMSEGARPFGIEILRAAGPYVEAVAQFLGNAGAGRVVEAIAEDEATTLGDPRFGLIQTGERNVARLGGELGVASGVRAREDRVAAYHALRWLGPGAQLQLFDVVGVGEAIERVVRRGGRCQAPTGARLGRMTRRPFHLPDGTMVQSSIQKKTTAHRAQRDGADVEDLQEGGVGSAPIDAEQANAVAPAGDLPAREPTAGQRDPAVSMGNEAPATVPGAADESGAGGPAEGFSSVKAGSVASAIDQVDVSDEKGSASDDLPIPRPAKPKSDVPPRQGSSRMSNRRFG